MRREAGVGRVEWLLEWRSPGVWITLIVALAYSIGETLRSSTFLDVASGVGAWLSSLLPLGMSIVWVGAARRDVAYRVHEMVDAAELPVPVRRVGELLGGLAVALAIGAVCVLAAAGLFAVRCLASPELSLACPSDLWLAGLLVAPVLLLWAALSRLLAVHFGSKVAYVGLVLLWAMGVWLRPPNDLLALTYAPRLVSQLVPLAREALGLLVSHRAVMLVLGMAAGLALLVTRSGRRPGDALRASPWLVVAACGLAGVAVPGTWSLEAAAPMPVAPVAAVEWVAWADASPRWVETSHPSGRALMAPNHARWVPELLAAIDGLTRMEESASPANGPPPEGQTTVVEVPEPRLTAVYGRGGLTVLLPERVTAVGNDDRPGIISRRLITAWVFQATEARSSSQPVGEGFEVEENARDGVRLFLEWVYARHLLPAEAVTGEVLEWRAVLGPRLPASEGTAGGADQLDISSLTRWRGGPNAVSTITAELALSLWDEVGTDAPAADLLEAYGRFAEGLTSAEMTDTQRATAFFLETLREVQREGEAEGETQR